MCALHGEARHGDDPKTTQVVGHVLHAHQEFTLKSERHLPISKSGIFFRAVGLPQSRLNLSDCSVHLPLKAPSIPTHLDIAPSSALWFTGCDADSVLKKEVGYIFSKCLESHMIISVI